MIPSCLLVGTDDLHLGDPDAPGLVAQLSCGRDVTALVTSRNELFACGNTGEPSRILRRVTLSLGEPPALLRPLSVACGSSWRETACVCAEGSRLVVRMGELEGGGGEGGVDGGAEGGLEGGGDGGDVEGGDDESGIEGELSPLVGLPVLPSEEALEQTPEPSGPSPYGAAVACGDRHVCVLLRGIATPAPLAGAVLDVRRRLATLDRFAHAPDVISLAGALAEPPPILAAQLVPRSTGLPRAGSSVRVSRNP